MQNLRSILLLIVLALSVASFVVRDDAKSPGNIDSSFPVAINGFEFEGDLSIADGVQSPDPNGNILMDGDFSDVAWDAAPASNGGLLVVGFRTYQCWLNNNKRVGIITHLDANGTVLAVHSSGRNDGANDNTSMGDVKNYRGFFGIEYVGMINGERTYIVAGASSEGAGVFYFTEAGLVDAMDHKINIAGAQPGSASGISPTSDGGFIVACNEPSDGPTFVVKLCADLSTQWVGAPEVAENESLYSKHVVEIALDNDGDGVGDQAAYATAGENGSGQGIYLTIWDDPAYGEDCNFSLAAAQVSIAHAVYHEGDFNPPNPDAGTKAKSIALNFAGDQIGIGGIDEINEGSYLLITLDLPLTVDNGNVVLGNFTYDTYPNNQVLSDCQETTSASNYAQVIIGHSSGDWIMAGRSSVKQLALDKEDDFKQSTEMSMLRVDANRNRIGNYEYFGDPHRRWGDVALGLTEMEANDDIAIVGWTRSEICWNILGEGGYDGNPCSATGNGNGFPNNCPALDPDDVTWPCTACCDEDVLGTNDSNCYQRSTKISRTADTYVVCRNIVPTQTLVVNIIQEEPCLAVIPTDGTAPFTFLWDDEDLSTTQKICDLAAGTYCVTVIDADCNIDTDCFTIDDAVVCPNPAFPNFGVGANGTNPTTNGGSDGTAFALFFNSDPGCEAATIVWSTGESTQQITGLSAGTYCVTVTDACGACESDCKTLTDPDKPDCPNPAYPNFGVGANGTNPTSNGGSDGTLYALYFNSTEECKGPVTIEWSNGATTQEVTGVSAGTYCVTVTDICGACQSDCKTLTNPERPTCPNPAYPAFGVGANGSNPTTAGGSDGTLYALYFNSTKECKAGPVTIEWSNGATSQEVTGVSQGTYCVTVTDACGACQSDCKTLSDPGTGQTVPKLAAPDQLLLDAIQLYPNPSEGQVTLVLPQAERRALEIFDAVGQRVLQKQNIQKDNLEINLSQLSPGIYWVKFKINELEISKKLILLE